MTIEATKTKKTPKQAKPSKFMLLKELKADKSDAPSDTEPAPRYVQIATSVELNTLADCKKWIKARADKLQGKRIVIAAVKGRIAVEAEVKVTAILKIE